ncbi:uncharacterized protein [Epargyreus clarus]|uniref:uncharacterized protein isoform X2 n=1 Tax=Epargyreus clarus TaxID=520877 RepID=UPI003C2EBBA3
MTTMAGPRKTVSVHDYPEHLNPFHEEDNHNKIRFWTIGRKLSRTNSISFSGIKDLKNSWSLRSFMKKGKKREQPATQTQSTTHNNSKPSNHQSNGDSPVVFRRAMQYSSMSRSTAPVGVADRYVYGGSVTPLPRSRFQERLRSSHQDINISNVTPRMARSDIMGSRLSMESTNPFDEECPVPPVRASRRKKKRAAPLPPLASVDATESVDTIPQVTVKNGGLELRITESEGAPTTKVDADEDLDELNLKIELKITEDEDIKSEAVKIEDRTVKTVEEEAIKVEDKVKDNTETHPPENNTTTAEVSVSSQKPDKTEELNDDNQSTVVSTTEVVKNTGSKDDGFTKESFPKVDIAKYRRNSSVNEDDIRLRRGNLEDFHSLSNKRSKSLTNTFDGSYVAYDINLNENNVDINSNEEPQKVTCKIYDDVRKRSIDNSISSTEKEFMEIDMATRELEREISKLNSALIEDDILIEERPSVSVSEIRQKFNNANEASSPNPIPKPRRSHYGDSPVNGNIKT